MKFVKLMMSTLIQTNTYPYSCIDSEGMKPPIISFGGTQNFMDLIVDDFWIKRKPWPDSKYDTYVHGGFARRTLRLADEMKEFIEKNDNFILGGHSLGGACAILLASYLVENNKNVQEIFTFGAPPLSSEEFQDFYCNQELWNKTYNFVIPDDPIVKNIPIYKFVGIRLDLYFKADSIWTHHDLESYESAVESYVQ